MHFTYAKQKIIWDTSSKVQISVFFIPTYTSTGVQATSPQVKGQSFKNTP